MCVFNDAGFQSLPNRRRVRPVVLDSDRDSDVDLPTSDDAVETTPPRKKPRVDAGRDIPVNLPRSVIQYKDPSSSPVKLSSSVTAVNSPLHGSTLSRSMVVDKNFRTHTSKFIRKLMRERRIYRVYNAGISSWP